MLAIFGVRLMRELSAGLGRLRFSAYTEGLNYAWVARAAINCPAFRRTAFGWMATTARRSSPSGAVADLRA